MFDKTKFSTGEFLSDLPVSAPVSEPVAVPAWHTDNNYSLDFRSYLKKIYGNNELEEKVLNRLAEVWKKNPSFIINTANEKTKAADEKALQERRAAEERMRNARSQWILDNAKYAVKVEPKEEPEPAKAPSNDFSNIANFNEAFRQASKAGLKTFVWKKTKGNPSGLFSTELASEQSEKKKETKGLDINTETLLKLKKKADELMPKAIPADELVDGWLLKDYLPNTRAFYDQLDELIDEMVAPSQKLKRDAAWNFAKAHGNFPGTFVDEEYVPDEYSENPSMRYNYLFNDYLLNEYKKLYGNIDVNWIQLNIEAELKNEKKAFDERVRKNQEKVQSKKQGGTMNKVHYFSQGGTAQNSQANAFMKAVLNGDPKAIGQLVQAANQGNTEATQLIQTILQEEQKGNAQVAKAASVIKQLAQGAVSAKWGSKLQYMKGLKYGKGGKTKSCPACEQQKVEMKKCGGKKAKKHFFGGEFDVNDKNPMRMSNGTNIVGIINRERFKNASTRGLSQTVYDSTGRPVVQKDKTSNGGEREIYYNIPTPIKRKGLFGPRHIMRNDTVYISGTPEMFENAPNMSTTEKKNQAYRFALGMD